MIARFKKITFKLSVCLKMEGEVCSSVPSVFVLADKKAAFCVNYEIKMERPEQYDGQETNSRLLHLDEQ